MTRTLLRRQLGPQPVGTWLSLLAIASLFLAWIMQAYSLIDWNGAVDLGLQNERFDGGPAEAAWALESWGVAMADMLWPLPLTIMALVGILRTRFYGFVTALMAMAIGVYFPLFFAFQRWGTHPETALVALGLFSLPCLLGMVGLWANRERYRE